VKIKAFLCAAAGAVAACASAPAASQAYPVKTVRIVVPTTPGGGTDTQARLLARTFQETMGQQFVVDNRGGASGIIGADLVAKSPPDGYTLLLTTAYLATNVSLFKKLPFDALKDLAPVGQISYAPQFLIVHPSVPAKSLKEFVALAKKNPGQLNAGSSGNGSANHLAVEMLKQAAGINVVHIPYKSGAPAMTALITGEVSFTFTGGVTALPFIRSGQVRALAVSSLKPSSAMPDVPTVASVYPGFESANWYALFAPAGTPPAAINRLSAELVKAVKTREIRDFLTREGAEPVGSTPQELGSYFRREVDRYAKVIRAGNIQAE
jgi:tripartite-type tricarboxylate transporter receptor subunit TctC